MSFTISDENGNLEQQKNLDSNAIGEFVIDNHRYLILLLSKAPNQEFDGESNKEVPQKVSHFEILGQYCAIVEAKTNSANSQQNLADLLTERELQIATLVSLGRVNKQIARQLHISPWTVATHIRRIFYKLGVDSRAAMVYRCASLIKYVQTENSCESPTQS